MKKRAGRPKLPKSDKVKLVALTVYPETRERIKKRAAADGKSMAKWIDEKSKL